MNIEAESIRKGKTALSYADSHLQGLCDRIQQAMSDAQRDNQFGKFKKCIKEIEEIMQHMRSMSPELVSLARTLEKLEYAVRSLEEE